jgi:hypothetical protein
MLIVLHFKYETARSIEFLRTTGVGTKFEERHSDKILPKMF